MAGSIFGDHCSPISDTTIMSSMASGADHVDHVRTQLPYALAAAAVGMLVGDIPTSFGLHPAVSLVVGIGLLYLLLRLFGKSVDAEVEARAGVAPG
jgi:Na+/H+ antiporter NhaC